MSTAIIISTFLAAAWAQEPAVDRVSVPLSNPSRAATVKASLMNGGITVKGYEGKEVIVEARSRGGEPRRSRGSTKAEGLKRLEISNTGLSVEEEENVVTVSASSMSRAVDISLQVPWSSSLKLKCMNDGDIVVERVQGEIDANNLNGGVTLKNISGAVVAHAFNKGMVVAFDKVAPDKTMSFSSFNGDIDVTLPADVKATVRLKSEHGDIYSDFDVKLDATARKPIVEDSKSKGGKYRVKFDKAMVGTINGGGPEFQFTTFNGKILIRKK